MTTIDFLQYEATTSEPVSEETLAHFRMEQFGTPSWPERYEPPLSQRPERVVILCENKLISIDMILPVAFELKHENPSLAIEFLFLRRDYMAVVRENYILWAGMEAVGNIRFLSYGGAARSTFYKRALNFIRIAAEVIASRRRRTLLVYRRDFSSWPTALVALSVRAGGGALISFPSIAYPMSTLLKKSLINQEPSTVHHVFQADRHLLFHPQQRAEQRRVTNAPMAVIGTTRWFPHWQNFLDDIIAERGILDIDGKPVDVAGKPNIIMFYPGNHPLPDLDGPTACRDQMLRTLNAIRRAAPHARILIKPHAICNIAELRRDIDPFSDLDIRLTFAHPLALAKYASVCAIANGSSVIDDMYVAGLPLIDASFYIPEIRKGGLFPNCGRLSCVTDAELESAFVCALTTPERIIPPERGHLFWPKVASLSQLFWKS